MDISDVYLGLGQDAFAHLIRGISIGKLKTYQIYEGFKVRAHLQKVNTEALRKAVPRLWERIASRDEDFRNLIRDGFGQVSSPLRSASTKLERTAAPVKDRNNHMRARRGHLVMRARSNRFTPVGRQPRGWAGRLPF